MDKKPQKKVENSIKNPCVAVLRFFNSLDLQIRNILVCDDWWNTWDKEYCLKTSVDAGELDGSGASLHLHLEIKIKGKAMIEYKTHRTIMWNERDGYEKIEKEALLLLKELQATNKVIKKAKGVF